MNTNSVFVSFWNICLENLPEGSITHRRIPSEDAKLRIDDARQRDALLCLSHDDLLAPYRKDALVNHRALCRVLREHHGIDLSIKDFCSNAGDDVDPLYSINPLGCVAFSNSNALLVVSCAYSLPEHRAKGEPGFVIAPATVEFHLLTASSNAGEAFSSVARSAPDLIGSMRDYADEMDEIVEDAMRQRRAGAWCPDREAFATLEALSEATGQSLTILLNEAIRLLLEQRKNQPVDGS